MGKALHMGGKAASIVEICVLSSQFCFKPKIAFKKLSVKKSNERKTQVEIIKEDLRDLKERSKTPKQHKYQKKKKKQRKHNN